LTPLTTELMSTLLYPWKVAMTNLYADLTTTYATPNRRKGASCGWPSNRASGAWSTASAMATTAVVVAIAFAPMARTCGSCEASVSA